MTRKPAATEDASVPSFPRRAADSHKGDYGRVLVIAGSLRMPGAALLATLGALRGGAGLVTLAAPEAVGARVAGHAPSAMHLPLPGTAAGSTDRSALSTLLEAAATCDAAAIGPGLSTEPETIAFVRDFLDASTCPLVVDADALTALASGSPIRRAATTVLTPHPGEFARLDGSPVAADAPERRERAEAMARRRRAIVVLKGHRTVVSDGARTYVNDTGNPGMATGGSGDVLCGVIAALLARRADRLDPLGAAILGVRVHGIAGDLAAEAGEDGLVATDLLAALPRAFRDLDREPPRAK